METLELLPDDTLSARVFDLRHRERKVLVELLRCLAEVERRKLYLPMGHGSLFALCTDWLGYAKASAYRRVTAARLVVRFPVVLDYLADGRLGLTTLCELRDVLEEHTFQDVLAQAAGRTEAQVKELVAALRAVDTSGAEVLRLVVTREFADDLEKARAALSHVVPDRNHVDVLHVCIKTTLRVCEKRRRGTGKAQRCDGNVDSRYVAAALRDAVWRRDEGCCAFVSADGVRCGSMYKLEVHHVLSWALGGLSVLDNLALRCAAHNHFHAEQDFGPRHAGRGLLH